MFALHPAALFRTRSVMNSRIRVNSPNGGDAHRRQLSRIETALPGYSDGILGPIGPPCSHPGRTTLVPDGQVPSAIRLHLPVRSSSAPADHIDVLETQSAGASRALTVCLWHCFGGQRRSWHGTWQKQRLEEAVDGEPVSRTSLSTVRQQTSSHSV